MSHSWLTFPIKALHQALLQQQVALGLKTENSKENRNISNQVIILFPINQPVVSLTLGWARRLGRGTIKCIFASPFISLFNVVLVFSLSNLVFWINMIENEWKVEIHEIYYSDAFYFAKWKYKCWSYFNIDATTLSLVKYKSGKRLIIINRKFIFLNPKGQVLYIKYLLIFWINLIFYPNFGWG